MNEMIYGNTGRRDEGINIDMDQALYQKLQSRMFVPKLKSMLSDRLQEGDKNFVFIGEVSEKTGNYSIYGYNAKLESDSRGGDYGHYVAVPSNEKTVAVDVNNVAFLTEEGFVEYVNLKTLNEEKRFKLSAQAIDIDINSKKRIVNNLMETFMKVRKRKNVTFSLEDCNVEEFNEKSLYVLIDLLKYIPYCMRKNISFISHVVSNQKLPEMINLAAYPHTSENKPHDCISLNAGAPFGNDGIFSEYVEKVFAMSDADREAYFEKIYEDIEKPAQACGVDVRSDLYLLDVSTKELWTNGNIKDAIVSIFNSISDVLNVYPMYAEMAKIRLSNNEADVLDYIKNRIADTTSIEELKGLYDNYTGVYEVTHFDISTNVDDLFKNKANEFIFKARVDSEIIRVVSCISSIGESVLDQSVVKDKFKQNMAEKNDINSAFSFYLKVKEKKFIDVYELNACLTKSIEEIILKETDKCSEAKEKLSILEKMYTEFQANCISNDYSYVKEVYAQYQEKFSSGASAEALRKGNEIIYDIEGELRGFCSFLDIKNHIIRLAEVDVSANRELKQKACDIYKRISQKMYEELSNEKLTYVDFKKLIQEISPAVKKLNDREVYDDRLSSGWGNDMIVLNGMYRFVSFFESMINSIGLTDNLTDVLMELEDVNEKIKNEEILRKMFFKYVPEIVLNWINKNKKQANLGALKKAEKELKNRHEKHLSHTVKGMFEKCLEVQQSRGRGKAFGLKMIIICAIALVVLCGLVFGGIFVYKTFFADKSKVNEEQIITYISEDEKLLAEQYIAGFDSEGFGEAQLVIATFDDTSAEIEEPIEEPAEDAEEGTTEEQPEEPAEDAEEGTAGEQSEEPAEDAEEGTAGEQSEEPAEDVAGGTVGEVAEEEIIKPVDNKYSIVIKDPLDSEFEEKMEVTYETVESKSKLIYKAEDIKANTSYVLVLQKDATGENTYIRDIFVAPANLSEYNFEKPYTDNIIKSDTEEQKFYSGLLKYVGYKKGLVEDEPVKEEKVEKDEQEEKENGSEKVGTEEAVEEGEEKAENNAGKDDKEAEIPEKEGSPDDEGSSDDEGIRDDEKQEEDKRIGRGSIL